MSWVGRTKYKGYANKSEKEQLRECLCRPAKVGPMTSQCTVCVQTKDSPESGLSLCYLP